MTLIEKVFPTMVVLLAVIVFGGCYLNFSDYETRHPTKCEVTGKYLIPEGFADAGFGQVALKTENGYTFVKKVSNSEYPSYVVGKTAVAQLSQAEMNILSWRTFLFLFTVLATSIAMVVDTTLLMLVLADWLVRVDWKSLFSKIKGVFSGRG